MTDNPRVKFRTAIFKRPEPGYAKETGSPDLSRLNLGHHSGPVLYGLSSDRLESAPTDCAQRFSTSMQPYGGQGLLASLSQNISGEDRLSKKHIVKFLRSEIAQLKTKDLESILHHRANTLQHQPQTRTKLKMGPQFVDLGRLIPGQNRLSIRLAAEKIVKSAKHKGIGFDGQELQPLYHDGKSILPLKKAKRAIAGPDGMVLITDGNHQVAASILAGATTVPVDIYADYQHLSRDAFWKLAKEKGLTYYKEYGGADVRKITAGYAVISNDPLRLLMRRLRAKNTDASTGETPHQFGVWMKIRENTADYLEFILADVIYTKLMKPHQDALREVIHAAVNEADQGKKIGPQQQKASNALRRVLSAAVETGALEPDALGILVF